MRIAVLRQLARPYSFVHPKMSVSYAAAVSTPNGGLRQPQIQARACSDPDLRASFEAQKDGQQKKPPQRPGVGLRAKTSFIGWPGATKKEGGKSNHKASASQPYIVEESRHSGHFPRTEHTPNTENAEEHVYILTLKLTDSLTQPMNEMRERYFPRKLNRTPAHLTLFHALPHSQIDALEQGLAKMAETMKPFGVSSGKPFRMRKGVGVNVDDGYAKMKDVHGELQAQWLPFLSEQDAGGFRPHWTVMNKVDDEKKVDGAFDTIRQELSERNQEGRAVGLDLWRYVRGDWVFKQEYAFEEGGKIPVKMQGSGSPSGRGGHLSPTGEQSPGGRPMKRPGMFKQGSSVGDAWRSMSFRRKS